MPDLTAIIQGSAAHAWLYLPIAVVLGALHALEPGHAKSLMAAYIVAIRGTTRQAVVLAVSAATGHTIIVWILAIAALALGESYIVDQAEPWLIALSGVLIVLLAIRMLWILRRRNRHSHHHGHDHDRDHCHEHQYDHGHSHEPPPISGQVGTGQIIWFGFTGGLLPCPAAIAVLLICIQLKAFALGVAMVAAFSVGLALTLIAIGLAVVWGSGKLAKSFPGFDRFAQRLPYLSAALVMAVGTIMTFAGLNAVGLFAPRKPN
jgi:nickel/cobalt transporter (NicO) family protein